MARDFLEDVEFKGKAVGIAPTADLELATKKYVDDKEVADNAITNAKLADMAGNTVKARVGGSSGDPTDLELGSHSVLGRNNGNIISVNAGNDTVLRRNTGNTLEFGKVGTTHFETGVNTSLGLADTAVQPASTNTLTNKTISGSNNTLSNIPQSAVTNLTSDLSGKEPTITAGTTSQYYRGDKTFQTLDKTAVGLGNVDNVSVTGAGMGVVVHGSTAGTARPSGFAVITWIGTVSPTNATNNDIWIDNS
jgi:hypothetical protein